MEKKYGVHMSKVMELKKFQIRYFQKKQRPKSIPIGDVTVVFEKPSVSKETYEGTLKRLGKSTLISVKTGQSVFISTKKIVNYSVLQDSVQMEFKTKYEYDRCCIKFNNHHELFLFVSLLPKIKKTGSDICGADATSGEEKSEATHTLLSSDEPPDLSSGEKTEAMNTSLDCDNPLTVTEISN